MPSTGGSSLFRLTLGYVSAYTGFAASQRVIDVESSSSPREIGTVRRDPLLVDRVTGRSITRPGGIYGRRGGEGRRVH